MNFKIPAYFLISLLSLNACAGAVTQTANQSESRASSGAKIESGTTAATTDSAGNTAEKTESNEAETADAQTKQPRTVRDFFNLLPQKYFTLEGCEPAKDKNCERARRQYVKTFLEVEDTPNGYWKSGCDGAQSCLTMALFKRPDATYIVHVLTEHEGGEDSYFLEYKNGKWSDIGASVVPEYSRKNTYVPPRQGTTVEVFKKNFPEPEYSERGAKIYDLQWKDGKFSIKK
jgi:hypothetical protein